MELRHLIYFKKVAELEHITKAADELLIAQPALSKVIRSLEEELNAPLFDRKGKNIQLNTNGQILLKYTNQILGCVNQAKAEINQQTSHAESSIIISYNSASAIIPILSTVFQKNYPDIKFQFADTQIAPELISFNFDSYFNDPDTKHCYKLFSEPCLLAFSKNHPLAKKAEIHIDDLRNETFLFSKNCHSTEHLTKFICESAGFEPFSLMECISNETVFSFIDNMIGIALIPATTWNFHVHPNVSIQKITPLTLERHLYITWSEVHELDQKQEIFLDFCRFFFEEVERITKRNNIFESDFLQKILDIHI